MGQLPNPRSAMASAVVKVKGLSMEARERFRIKEGINVLEMKT